MVQPAPGACRIGQALFTVLHLLIVAVEPHVDDLLIAIFARVHIVDQRLHRSAAARAPGRGGTLPDGKGRIFPDESAG